MKTNPPNNKGLLRAVTKHFITASLPVQTQLFQPQYNTGGTAGSQVEVREEKWVVFYRTCEDSWDRNGNVKGVILVDPETGTEVKMTTKEMAVAAGLKW